ncbi:hypothetical protein GHT09_017270 [Marmota monax]|uniref:Ig-like domain-containing protein n=1 Tax=Marmota monax TaxID=9995 RepID=A0A834Q652_MARMO|nr:hypothetical protein GHT09_017270 [Marmota monax]
MVLRGQDCTMTCAFLGNPRPTVTLYKGDVNITANSKFWYNSTSGVCTLVIPTCTLKDSGEYSVLVENELGKDRSSCTLTVYGKAPKSPSCQGQECQAVISVWGPLINSLHLASTIFYSDCHLMVQIFSGFLPLLDPLSIICYVPGPCRCKFVIL